MEDAQVERVLKRDALGRVELVAGEEGRFVRRVACGGRAPGSRWLARLLLARERRALERLDGLPGVARLLPVTDGGQEGVLHRSYIRGTSLTDAQTLPRDFFERLEELVRACHARGVCHNDLHKEQNVLVDEEGYPALVDFQLASVHERSSARFASRCREDLRHVEKLDRRYHERGDKSGPRAPRRRRSAVAWLWLRLGKPAYRLVAGALSARDGERRRPSAGPWPDWSPPVGPRSLPSEPGPARLN